MKSRSGVGFDRSHLIGRHFPQEHVRSSLDGWSVPENDFIEGLLGSDCKKVESDSKPIEILELIENEAPVDKSSLAMIPMKQDELSNPLQRSR